jgi:hypothetical protein
MHSEFTFIIVALQAPGRRRVYTAITMDDLLRLSHHKGVHKWSVSCSTSVAQERSYTSASGIGALKLIE